MKFSPEAAADESPKKTNLQRWVEAPLIFGGALTVFGMMFLSVSDAMLRSFFNAPIFGANDYTQIILAFSVAFSLPLCVLAGRVIAIDTLVNMLPTKIARVLSWLVTLLGSAMLGWLSWRCLLNGLDANIFGETTLLLQLPFGPSYYALAVGCFLSSALLLLERIRS
ncbi:MAG: TRAP transporter small permease [Cohaesibacteraceae bacterium]|nr:TRAP transporter small permease [Cohaesibacteraceae bacterium]